MTRSPTAELVAALAGRVDALVPALLSAARQNGGVWSVGSIENEVGHSLWVYRAGARAGKWRDAATGDHGDLLDLIGAVHRLDQVGARDWARRWLGHVDTTPRRRRRDDGADARNARCALGLWREARPDSLVATYLRGRGITLPVPPTLRLHTRLKHAPTGLTMRGMVAAVQAPGRAITAIHRTYLTETGEKAPISQPKMALGPLGAGAVRLCHAAPELGIAEGIETALSATQLFGIGCWAALGSRLDAVALPPEVERVVIFADAGAPGAAAAERARHRLEREGRTIRIEAPPTGDWNDVLQAQRGAA